MHLGRVVQLQALGPHVARRSVSSGPQNLQNWNLLKSAWSLICLTELFALNKVHLHKNNEYDQFCAPFCFVYLLYDQIRRYGPPLTLHWGTWLDNLCVFSVPRCSLRNELSTAK